MTRKTIRGGKPPFKATLRTGIELAGEIGLRIVKSPSQPPGTLWERKPESRTDGGKIIAHAIEKGAPFLAGRLGNDEFETLERWRRKQNSSRLSSFFEMISIGDPLFSLLRSRKRAEQSGLRPLSSETQERFHALMTDAFEQVDVLASWVRGETYYGQHFSNALCCRLHELEPYRSEQPWTRHLSGRNVLVVHPFEQTILNQHANNRSRLFPNLEVLPNFNLITYCPPRSHFGEIRDASHWFELFEHMVGDISQLQFDVAIVGAGPFGLPLSAAVKRSGKVAIHMGGATQLLFGIMGRRWASDPLILKLKNDSWVYPNASETPSRGQRRRSPYWK